MTSQPARPHSPEELREQIHQLLRRYDSLSLECDGFTRVASFCLAANGIIHQVMGGRVESPHGAARLVVQPHYWIVAAGWTVDYRLRMWLGADMPHGVFVPPAELEYVGGAVPLECPEFIYIILAEGVPAVPAAPMPDAPAARGSECK